MLFALDPIVDHDQLQPTGLESFLKDMGVDADNTLVFEFDPAHLLAKTPVPTLFFVTAFGNHRTTNLLAATDARILVHQARSVRPQSGSSAIALLETSKQALTKSHVSEFIAGAEVKKEANDIEGPVSIAVAVVRQNANAKGKAQGRIVVIGDSDWMQGAMLNNPALSNANLMTAFVGWLTERDALISIAPKKGKAVTMNVSEADLGAVLFRVLGIIPGTVFLLGLLAWWSRRS